MEVCQARFVFLFQIVSCHCSRLPARVSWRVNPFICVLNPHFGLRNPNSGLINPDLFCLHSNFCWSPPPQLCGRAGPFLVALPRRLLLQRPRSKRWRLPHQAGYSGQVFSLDFPNLFRSSVRIPSSQY